MFNASNNISGINVDNLRKSFLDSWPILIKELKADKEFEGIPQILNWVEHVLEENVTKGKQARALALCLVYRTLVPNPTPEQEFLCNISGWLCEIGQAAALIADDIMDGSPLRRGKPAWYTNSHIGLSAINDAFLLENLTWTILRKYFKNSSCYSQLLSLLQETVMETVLGQSLDTRCSLDGDMSKYTPETYAAIVKFKTSYYTFYQPVAAAMVFAGKTDPVLFDTAKEVLCDIGHLFQVQDDYLDCFGDIEETGKIGTDIIDNKCSWLVVKALELAKPEQKDSILAHYGTGEGESKVKAIYKELGLRKVYREFERSTYNAIKVKLDKNSQVLGNLTKTFVDLLDNMYLRKK